MPVTADETWLLKILSRENLPEPTVKLSSTGKSWSVRSRGRKIGRPIKAEAVRTRREDLVVQVAEQRRSIAVDLILPLQPSGKGKRGEMPPLERAPDLTWDEATGDFFAASDLIQAVMNRTTVQRVLADEVGDGTKTAVLLSRAIAEVQQDWAERAQKGKKEHRKRWERRAGVVLSGTTHDLVRAATEQSVAKWQGAQLTERFPMRSGGQPIPLRAECVQLRITEKQVDVGVRVTDAGWKYFGGRVRGHAHLGLLQHDYRVLGSKLKWDDRISRWRLDLAIGTRRRPAAEGIGTMMVRVGMKDVLYGLGDDGWMSYFRSTDSLLHRKNGFLARKAKKRGAMREPSRGRRGHGRAVRYRTYTAEVDNEARFVETWWGQTAKKIADIAVERGYATVLVSDLSKPLPKGLLDKVEPRLANMLKRFPSAKGRDAIVWACDKVGVTAVVTSDGYNAKLCPACGCDDEVNHDRAKAGFRCVACDLEMPSQYAAGWNSLAAAGVDCKAVKRRGRAMSKATKELREKKR